MPCGSIYYKKLTFLVTVGFLDLLISLTIPVFVVLETSSVTCKFSYVEAANDGLKKIQTITVILCTYKMNINIRTGIARAERDGTRAETRSRLSPKRTSQFKLVGASVQSTAGSRGVRISLSNAG